MLSIHVDDIKGTGDSGWFHALLAALERDFGKCTTKIGNFEHCGVEHRQQADFSVLTTQDSYRKSLQAIVVSKERMTQIGESVTSSELEALRSLVGGLAWLVLTRADIAIWITTVQ